MDHHAPAVQGRQDAAMGKCAVARRKFARDETQDGRRAAEDDVAIAQRRGFGLVRRQGAAKTEPFRPGGQLVGIDDGVIPFRAKMLA